MNTPREISESYWAAESARDLASTLSHYAPYAVYAGLDGIRTGHAEIERWYAASFHEFPGLSVRIVREFPAGDSSAIEFEATLTDPHGKRFLVLGVNVVHVAGGRFTSVRSYEDPLGEPLP
jgi:hypothetical protein